MTRNTGERLAQFASRLDNAGNGGPVDVRSYGAVADGVTDNFAAIQAADTAAAALGVSVFFPGGVFGVDCTAASSPLFQTTHWIGHDNATIQRLDYTATTAQYTVSQEDQTNLITFGLTFDGQVTLRSAGATPNVDPTAGAYVAEGDDNTETLWTAMYGFVVRGGSGSYFTECTFKNFLRAGLRFDDDVTGNPIPSDCVVDKCKVDRTRGIFGDGIFLRGGDEVRITNCRVSDYQRIAYVMEFSTVGAREPKDILIDNCIAYYGHDAIVNESNAGFWIETADNVVINNCITNYSGIGFLGNSTGNTDAGTTRAYTAHHVFNNCTALNTHNPMLLRYNGDRNVQVDVSNFAGQCYIFNATTGPIHSNWVGTSDGVRVEWDQNTAGNTAVFNLTNIKIEMMDWGVYGTTSTEIGAFSLRNQAVGAATTAQQLVINIDNFQTEWNKTTPAGDDDIVARTLYETATIGHFGDFTVVGYQDYGGGTDYRARAIINVNNFANHTFGYVMGAVQLLDGELNVNNTRLSLREPNIRSGGKLSVSNSTLFDYRGNIGFDGQIKLHSVEIDDANPSSTDRSNLSITGTHQISDSKVLRQIRFDMNAGSATDRKLRLKLNNVEWFVPFDTESGLYMAQASSLYSAVMMNGCTFRNDGTGAMGAADKMIECAQTGGLIQFYGAGNAFDSSMVTAGGHVVQYTSAPAYNDDPTTAATPWYTVMGVNAVFGVI